MTEQKQNTNGFIEWKVTGSLLHRFKNATYCQKFRSPKFETTDGTIWRILFYPHGDRSPDDCSIFLQCVKLNEATQPIGVNYSFDIMELDWCYDGGDTFRGMGKAWGDIGKGKAEKLNNLQLISIKCFVEETMDVTNDNTYFEWKVSHQRMGHLA
eukprot:752484_1